jgi:DNA-binding NarL/FixJ family response regulator
MKNETSQSIRALIVGNSHIMRSGLRRILESQSNILVLGEIKIGNLNDLDAFRGQHPDIVLIDLGAHGTDALVWIRKVKQYLTGTDVLVICDLGDDRRARKALDLGATGVFLKMQPPSVLIATIESLCGHQNDHIVSRNLAPNGRSTPSLNSRENPNSYNAKIERLTEREREIIPLIATGLKNKDIAGHLHISDITVRHHLTNIFMKLGVSDRQKLLILAHQHGLARLALNPKYLDPLLSTYAILHPSPQASTSPFSSFSELDSCPGTTLSATRSSQRSA